MLKNVLPPAREEITEKWKRLNNELLIQHYSADQIKKNERIGAGDTIAGEKVHVEIWCGNPNKRKYLKRPCRRREDNIRIEFQSIGWGRCVLNVSGSGFRQVTGCSDHGDETSVSIKRKEFLD